jgi:hypothetical protein
MDVRLRGTKARRKAGVGDLEDRFQPRPFSNKTKGESLPDDCDDGSPNIPSGEFTL